MASISRSPRPSRRFDLLDVPLLGRFLRWKHARSVLQIPLFLLAVLMIWDGLTGAQIASRNTATIFAWVHYRGLVVLALLVAGNLFCMGCPFMLPRNALRRFIRPTRMWPKPLRTKWVAVALLISFFFTYELFDLWASPWWTAWIIVAYFGTALLIDSFFAGASFCKYVCPLGQFNLASSLVSPLEVKVRNPQQCLDCRTKDCIKGNDYQHGCELWLFQQRKVGNMDCTFCLDCVHACPYDNVGISARIPVIDLVSTERRSGIGIIQQRPDMTVLFLLLTFGALLNAFGMVRPVYALQEWMAAQLGTTNESIILGLLFTMGLIIEPAILLGGAAWLSRFLAQTKASLLELIGRYALGLFPLGFGIWLAHYLFHFLIGLWSFVPALRTALQDLGLPSGWLPQAGLAPAFSASTLDTIELLAISGGAMLSLWVLWRIAQRESRRQALLAFMPWSVVVLILMYSAFWLMEQPMEMRGTSLISG